MRKRNRSDSPVRHAADDRRDAAEPAALLARVDHLVYAGPDLRLTIGRVEELLGVRATPGGPHPGRGTRNALISLGPDAYLEIIGPDPEQPESAKPRWFGIDHLTEPRLVTWAAKGRDLAQLVETAHAHGVGLGEVIAGSRRRPDGVLLSWQVTDINTVVADGIVPFFIDWGDTPHPARTAAGGVSLLDLRAEHTAAEYVQGMLHHLGVALPVQSGTCPALIATLACPRGRVELR